MSWRVVFTTQARRDAKKLAKSGLKSKAQDLLDLLAEDPYRTQPRHQRLLGDLAGAYSRRPSIQHRLVYEVLDDERVVKVIRTWTHYE